MDTIKQKIEIGKVGEIGKILLIIGVLFLIDPLVEVLIFYYWYGFLGMLFIGWLLTILGAAFISLRTSAWAVFLTGFYLMFIFYKLLENEGGNIGFHLGPLLVLIVILHILLGLILSTISFQRSKKRRSAIYNKNRHPA